MLLFFVFSRQNAKYQNNEITGTPDYQRASSAPGFSAPAKGARKRRANGTAGVGSSGQGVGKAGRRASPNNTSGGGGKKKFLV